MALNNIKHHTASRHQFLLVVDSDDASLSNMSAMLDRFKYRICTARSAEEALEVTSVITPALIVVAQKLDDMPGLDLLRKLKKAQATQAVPFIMLTCEKDPAHDRACLSSGAVVCLPAPCQIEDLFRVIQMTIEPIPRMNMRITTQLPVTINNRTVEWEDGACASNLSEQGAFVTTPRPYPLRTRLPLRILLEDSVLEVKAEVIYSSAPDKGGKRQPGMGLQFVDISLEDQMRIRNYIRDELTRGTLLAD